MDKCSSLLWKIVTYGRKKFYDIGDLDEDEHGDGDGDAGRVEAQVVRGIGRSLARNPDLSSVGRKTFFFVVTDNFFNAMPCIFPDWTVPTDYPQVERGPG